MIEPHTPEKIHHGIAYRLSKGVSYIDALVDYAKEHSIEIETIAEIVKKSAIIKEQIKSEAIKLNLMKRDKDARQLCD